MKIFSLKKFFQNIQFKLFLEEWEIDSKKFSYASEVDKKNIILRNMNALLKIAKLDNDEFITNMNIIRLLSTQLYYVSNSALDAETQLQLNERITDLLNELNLVMTTENLEQKVIQDYAFSEDQIQKYFNYNQLYSLIANAFAAPFIQEENYYLYYEYAYYLSMYLNLHYFSNVQNINPDFNVFLAKLSTQTNMVSAIQTINPVKFNDLIIKNNKWIGAIRFKKMNKENQ
ncbi:hypothetical protein ELUMI_v1c02500 [Williamsoniiplasma luminosum]|uniref:Uncharacterized protein n=1 Tax=Williamsoniiplasma luminosum TaxID=214888 RepID=A0A2K8NT07_9MOLU|nr:hypothetical protein [Williamsoniiplasma luminosum]ATZ16975.1 hypothetical protein ELUMI_v1c02500 [Williamsoniiplasma luminosum]